MTTTDHPRRRRITRVGWIACAAAVAVGSALVSDDDSSTSAAPVPRSVEVAAQASDMAERVDPPEPAVRPQVYLAYHGSEQLLGNRDHLWPYVRQNLDGLWGNPFAPNPDPWASLNRTIELTRKVATRKLIIEHPIAVGGRCQGWNDDWYQGMIETMAPDIRYDRIGVAIYAGENPDCWGANGGIDAARSNYGAMGFGKVMTLFQPQNLSSSVNAGAFPTIRPGSSGDVAYRNSDGVVLECPIDACLDPTFGAPFFDAIRAAHARGVPFIWFTGYHTSYGIGQAGWLAKIQAVYNTIGFLGLWRAEDAIMIINYHGVYPALPERNPDGSPADTVTGILAWLLEQRPIAS